MNFEELYKSTFPGLYRFFYYKSVDSALVEDLVQDVYIRFYNKFSQKELSETESRKILYGIAKNVFKEWVRASMKERKVSLFENYEYEELDQGDLLDIFLSYEVTDFDKKLEEKKILLKDAMDKLSENVRQVIQLRFIEGMTRKETAERLGMKEKDVHTYQKRGIKYLKNILNA